jgi:DNA-binding IclR family transcriptional regulator
MQELTGTLPKALLLLEFMALKQRHVSFKELKAHSGFAPNVLSRILKTFIHHGYFAKDPDNGLYALGASSYRLCETVLGRRSKKDVFQPILDGLAVGLMESAAYFDFDGEWINLLAKAEVANSYHYLEVNSREIHSPINGFFFTCLPYLSAGVVKNILSKRDDYYGYKDIDLSHKFELIKEHGYHLSQEFHHRSRITRICAPVFEGESSRLIGSLGVTVISHDLVEEDERALIEAVKSAAENASRSVLENEHG